MCLSTFERVGLEFLEFCCEVAGVCVLKNPKFIPETLKFVPVILLH